MYHFSSATYAYKSSFLASWDIASSSSLKGQLLDRRQTVLAGRPWQSILVKTGVFRGPGSNSEKFPADLVVNDVEEAVAAALSA